MIRALALLSVAFLFTASLCADDATKNVKLDGTWVISRSERGGKPFAEPLGDKITFAGDKITIQGKKDNKEQKGTVSVDTKKSPAHIDLKPEGAPEGVMLKGIYAMKDGKLQLCFGKPGDARPKKFESVDGSKNVLFTLTKSK